MLRPLTAVLFALTFALTPLAAQAQRKACEDLKAEIEAKLEKKGVTGYQLEIVAAGEEKDRTVVGSCDGNTRRIVYTRG